MIHLNLLLSSDFLSANTLYELFTRLMGETNPQDSKNGSTCPAPKSSLFWFRGEKLFPLLNPPFSPKLCNS